MNKREMSALVLRLSPRLQQYDWGDPVFIPRLLGMVPKRRPIAEAWFGAHPLAPATAICRDGAWPLNQLIKSNPEAILGPTVSARYGELPYLLKIIAVSHPLSIQAHADTNNAIQGFIREETEGIPRDARERNYPDSKGKPEMLVALQRFDLLSGFKPFMELESVLDRLKEVTCLLSPFCPSPKGLQDFLAEYFELDGRRLHKGLAELLSRLHREDEKKAFQTSDPEYWALLSDRHFSSKGYHDPGIFLIFLLNLISLQEGEAIFLAPGTPHAYLKGAGIEIMSNSNNTIRAGLTRKHVDTKELLKILCFDTANPKTFRQNRPENRCTLERFLPAHSHDFALRRIHVSADNPQKRQALGPEIILAITKTRNAVIKVKTCNETLELYNGSACLVPHGMHYYFHSKHNETCFLATISDIPASPKALGRG